MELYIGEELVSDAPKVWELESALTKVRALKGKKDLCLQQSEDGPQLILDVIRKPLGYGVEHVKEDVTDVLLTGSWKEAADCMRRFMAGRPPFPKDSAGDACPLCSKR